MGFDFEFKFALEEQIPDAGVLSKQEFYDSDHYDNQACFAQSDHSYIRPSQT